MSAQHMGEAFGGSAVLTTDGPRSRMARLYPSVQVQRSPEHFLTQEAYALPATL
ncbi:MAG: hypothetical protein M3P51_08290 [Chloroflexota bacterium]|nr:hypothetical protein [Chloroflexota bacterium]